MLADEQHQGALGKLRAAFFATFLPGNIPAHPPAGRVRDGYGRKRFVRLFFQPALIYGALKSTELGKGD